MLLYFCSLMLSCLWNGVLVISYEVTSHKKCKTREINEAKTPWNFDRSKLFWLIQMLQSNNSRRLNMSTSALRYAYFVSIRSTSFLLQTPNKSVITISEHASGRMRQNTWCGLCGTKSCGAMQLFINLIQSESNQKPCRLGKL